jgi:Zn-finger nucleic acid-binding protein
MNCPVCDNSRLREMEKNGIQIDVCPSCKGVWLDRGELEKVMQDVREVRQDYNEWYYGEANAAEPSRLSQPQSQPQYQQPSYQQQNKQPYYGSHPQGHPHHKKKKKSVLDVFGDLFD